MVETESKRTVLILLVCIQAAQIVMAGNQPSPQMFILQAIIMLTLRQSPSICSNVSNSNWPQERVPNAEILAETATPCDWSCGQDRDSIDISH